MSGKCRPCLRKKTLENVFHCNLSQTDKECIYGVFDLADRQKAEIERLQKELETTRAYIHDNGLEWDLMSKKEMVGDEDG